MDIEKICEHIRSHGVIVYPTDTLYGLGANPFDEVAVERIFELKRMEPRVMSVAFSSFEEAKIYAKIPEKLSSIFPGPITIIARAKGNWKYIVKDGKIGVRVPDNNTALDILKECGPLTSTSANIHGEPSLKRIEDIMGVFGEKILYVKGENPKYNTPSTIVDITDGFEVIREGAVPSKKIRFLMAFK
jgi:L-threonylcarbamoyladenylate synthase